jgi:hypothetical protein
MKFFAAIKAVSAVHQVRCAFLLGGPVGVYYTLKLARIKRRLARVSHFIHCENATHREHIAALNVELNELISAHQGTNIAAAHFWKHCAKQPEAQS